MHNPISTYRIQFHKDFGFEAFEKVISYLQKLGVGTVYASPIFSATPGSTHGYDGTNPNKINPEIGTEAQLRTISSKLKNANISWLQDIVPNHMAFHSDNAWLMDVLEHGRDSKYANFFDILWWPDASGHLMVPFLGDTLDNVISNRELKLAIKDGKVMFRYFDAYYPVLPKSYSGVLNTDTLPSERQLEGINSNPELIRQIAYMQNYRLCHWQETDSKINYRRFFTVNGLICLNIQNDDVFEEYHRLVERLTKDGVFQGLRIDHIDGLCDPAAYLSKLRSAVGDDVYIVVEKILEQNEALPNDWLIQGSSGYDFLALVNNVFTNRDAEGKFTQFYQRLANDDTSIKKQLCEKKLHILTQHMGGELNNLYQLFTALHLSGTDEEVSEDELKDVIAAFLVLCPVYRYYGNRMPLDESEASEVRQIFGQIRKEKKHSESAIDVLENVLLNKPREGDQAYNDKVTRFYKRCMQFTGPLMAKGMEDTLMYTYNRFLGHNDVGDTPEAFGVSVADFHQKMADRQEQWPLSINATSTHDTKRGEDVRARLNVLTDIEDIWFKAVKTWQKENRSLRTNGMPDANDEYFIYQTLAGACPMPGEADTDFPERIKEYIQKAQKEAKVHTSWTSPNTEYEAATARFVDSLLDKNSKFWQTFQELQQKIVDHGIVNALAQVILKFTCPGVPDVYQGTEFWDLNLVDPDNRRAVDYEHRMLLLDNIADGADDNNILLQRLWADKYRGDIKLWLVQKLMQMRRQHTALFEKGHYIPLQVKGKHKEHVLAFARRYKKDWLVVAVPLHTAILCKSQKTDVLNIDWKDTRILLPDDMPDTNWEYILSSSKKKGKNEIDVADIFDNIPLAVLKVSSPANDRDAGVLLSLTSLPSVFGIGDMGPGAYRFARFLSSSHQRYWQLLPLNPIEAGSGYSPYSSYSSMAGNTLLISPEMLVSDGLLTKHDIKEQYIPSSDKADYEDAVTVRKHLFDIAYQRFADGQQGVLKTAFQRFCKQESYWLDDFALYVTIKEANDCRPWFEWPDELKKRDRDALQAIQKKHESQIQKIKWLQFIFLKQWQKLKSYCNALNIEMFGDMPFYVSYDSVDVWANPDIFCLDDEGNLAGIAGVPPDYFSEDGQLWGMPTFRWDILKKNGYKWWIDRLKKNLELFDLLRIDHFRAFAEYWKVPTGEETAKNGEWLPGPGTDFFEAIEKALGKLPFVAEDLGDNMDKVYVLRDKIGLPGMKVLQFAFGDHLPASVDAPHNYDKNCIVYTGTHDNNTSLGWYLHESNKQGHKWLEHYLGYKPKTKDIHLVLGQMAYASVANTAILPMQDILGLGEEYRMNVPGRGEGNWMWRLQADALNETVEKRLRNWTKWYNRD